MEGGWLLNDLKKESRRRAWGTKSAALRTRDKIDFMSILSPDPARKSLEGVDGVWFILKNGNVHGFLNERAKVLDI